MYKRLNLQNFLSWEELYFDFPKGVTLIEGFNYDDNSPEGCGKSAILNGLTWIIYGEIPKPTAVKVHEIIREGCTKASGSLLLESGHIIERTRGKRTGTLNLILPNGTPYVGKDTKETQKFIDELMGMAYATFLQSVYFAQNYGVKFITSDEVPRVKVLSDIADLTVFDKAVKETTALIKVEKDSKKITDMTLSNAKHQLQEKIGLKMQLEGYKKAAEEEAKENKRKLSEKFEAKVEEAETLEAYLEENTQESVTEALKETSENLTKTEDEIQEINVKLSSIDPLKAERRSLAKALDGIEDQINKTSKTIMRTEGSLRQIDESRWPLKQTETKLLGDNQNSSDKLKAKIKQLENPEDPKCPTCGTELESLEEGHFEAEIKELKSELKSLKARAKEIKEDHADELKKLEANLEAGEAELKESKAELKEYKEAQIEAIKEIEDFKIPDLSKFTKQLEEKRAEKRMYTEATLELKSLRQEITLVERDYEKVKTDILEINEELEKLEDSKNNKFDKDLKAAAKELKIAKEQVDTLEGILAETENSIKKLTKLREGFKETKAYTFKALLRDLTNKSNYYLAQLFDLPIEIEFTNETEAGGIAKITDVVRIGDIQRPFALYSGGQSRRIQLAVDLALSDIVASRADKAIGIRLFDEYCKDLSENSMEKVLELFEELEGSVLMIEHNSIIKNVVTNTVEIELRNKVSRCL